MNEIILEGSKFSCKENLHQELKKKLILPDYYGNNLDALWDCLTSDVVLPINIKWLDFQRSKELLGDYADKTLELFIKASNVLGNDFKISIY